MDLLFKITKYFLVDSGVDLIHAMLRFHLTCGYNCVYELLFFFLDKQHQGQHNTRDKQNRQLF